MVDYDELYDYLRKEKYSEQLQVLPKNFVTQVSDFLIEKRKTLTQSDNLFSDNTMTEKKQFENSLSIFRELVLRRKKKILNLVFVASETGIMKRDFGNMLKFEQELFERLINSVDEADKSLQEILNGKNGREKLPHKLIIVDQDVEEFVDMTGTAIGPFKKGSVANLDSEIADILVSEGKARVVDD